MRFSQTEREHLLKAWLAISFAFALLFADITSSVFIVFFVISLLTVGLGFLLHELAHKYVAQQYGCWAEFRADDRMLLFAILSAFAGFIIAAPGAVWIRGNVTTEKNGKISVAGPVTNIVLALLFLFGSFLLEGIFAMGFDYGFRVNAFLGLFNMIPAGNFDGAKVLRWNRVIYAATTLVAAALVFGPMLPIV